MTRRPTGIRLRHPDPAARGRVCTFGIRSLPLVQPTMCGMCGTVHTVKTYHLHVDSDGVAYVSAEIWATMQRYNEFAGFQLADETRGKPPTQVVGLGGGVQLDVMRMEAN